MTSSTGAAGAVPADAVTVTVPASPEHLALLRLVVAAYAARENFTIDHVDDLRMAVEETAVQLLRASDGAPLTLAVRREPPVIEAALSARVADGVEVLEADSWSWMILRALVDDISLDRDAAAVTVRLRKAGLDHGDVAADGTGPADTTTQAGAGEGA